MNPERRLVDIKWVLDKYESGEWSALTALAAIRRIHYGQLTVQELT